MIRTIGAGKSSPGRRFNWMQIKWAAGARRPGGPLGQRFARWRAGGAAAGRVHAAGRPDPARHAIRTAFAPRAHKPHGYRGGRGFKSPQLHQTVKNQPFGVGFFLPASACLRGLLWILADFGDSQVWQS